jgi:hypothetical protein
MRALNSIFTSAIHDTMESCSNMNNDDSGATMKRRSSLRFWNGLDALRMENPAGGCAAMKKATTHKRSTTQSLSPKAAHGTR